MSFIAVPLPIQQVEIIKSHGDIYTPGLATDGSVGYDLYSQDEQNIQPGETKVFDTGLTFLLPNELWLEIKSRSSLAVKGVNVQGGVVDSDYRGNVKVVLLNTSTTVFNVKKRMRIAQAVFHTALRPVLYTKPLNSVANVNDERETLLARIRHLEQNDETNQRLIQDLLRNVTIHETSAVSSTIDAATSSNKRTGGFGSTGI